MRSIKSRKPHAGRLAGAFGLLLALAFATLSPVLAQLPAGVQAPVEPNLFPLQPHWFHGSVAVCGATAPEGTVISARIDETEYATTTVDAQGKYGIAPPFYVPADDPATPEKEGGAAGDSVEFYVLDSLAGTSPFEIGQVTELPLEAVQVPLTVTSDGCCEISVAYDAITDTVSSGESKEFASLGCGTVVTLTATATGVCGFGGWQVDGSAVAGNPITVSMDAAHTAVATCSGYGVFLPLIFGNYAP